MKAVIAVENEIRESRTVWPWIYLFNVIQISTIFAKIGYIKIWVCAGQVMNGVGEKHTEAHHYSNI